MTFNGDPVLSTEDALDNIVIIKNGTFSALICSSENNLFVYSVNGPDTSLENWQNVRLCQCFKLNSNIFDILPYENKVFIVLVNGILWSLESADACQEDENDIFEMEDSPETINSWTIVEVCSLPYPSFVLSASVSKLGVCILSRTSDMLQLFIIKRKIVSSYSFGDNSSGSGCCCVLNISNLSFDFMNLWFPHVERWEEFLLVGLSNGTLYCFPLTFPLKSYDIYRSIHSIISISWYQNRQSERFDALIIILDSGAVIRLTPIGEEVSFPFLPFLNSVVALKNCILSRAELESRYLILSNKLNESKLFPVSELTCACNCNDSRKMLLVCNKSGDTFLLNEDKLSSFEDMVKMNVDTCNPLPKISDLQKLMTKSLQLSKINKTVKIHDEYLRARSLISRIDILKKHFQISLKIVQILEDRHTMRLKISFDLPGIVFSKDFWKLKVNLSSVSSNHCFVKDLNINISFEQNLVQLITLPISFDLLYNIDCKLFSYVESKNFELNLPLGIVEMDASYFLLPPSLKDLCLNNQDSLKSHWISSKVKYSLTVNLLEIPSNNETFFANLICNSKALWRHSEWKKMLKNSVVSCILFGTEINFTLNKNALTIESWNLKACQAVRLAFYRIVNQYKVPKWKEILAHSLIGWHQAENIILFSLNPEGHINDLYNILRSTDLSS